MPDAEMKSDAELPDLTKCYSGPLEQLPYMFDSELLRLAEEVRTVSQLQKNLSEQMFILENEVMRVREKHRNFMVCNQLIDVD